MIPQKFRLLRPARTLPVAPKASSRRGRFPNEVAPSRIEKAIQPNAPAQCCVVDQFWKSSHSLQRMKPANGEPLALQISGVVSTKLPLLPTSPSSGRSAAASASWRSRSACSGEFRKADSGCRPSATRIVADDGRAAQPLEDADLDFLRPQARPADRSRRRKLSRFSPGRPTIRSAWT